MFLAGNIKKMSNVIKSKVFVCGQYVRGVIDFYSIPAYNRFRIIENTSK